MSRITLKLTPEQTNRLTALNAGHGNRRGSGIFPGTRFAPKITPEQLIEVQRLDKLGWKNKPIRIKVGISEYITRMAVNGHYNYILIGGK